MRAPLIPLKSNAQQVNMEQWLSNRFRPMVQATFLAVAGLNIGLMSSQHVFGDDSLETSNNPAEVRKAIQSALPLLETSSAGSADQRKCFTCHSQALPVMAISEARKRSFEIDMKNHARQIDHTVAHLKKGKSNYEQGKGQGGGVDTAGYALWTLEVGEFPANQVTDAVTHYLVSSPGEADFWKCSSHRPPSESSDFTTTYLAIRALKYYGNPEQQISVQERFDNALKWLLDTAPVTVEDRVFHLRSLDYLDAPPASLKLHAESLIEMQQPDGGWAQTEGMDSDPYATATVMVGLIRTRQITPESIPYQRGLSFLLKHQTDRGSWHVVSRSKPFQKYFETGFPHEKDQFISTTATAWATIALLLALPEKETTDPKDTAANPPTPK